MTFQELSDYNDLYMLQEADWSGLGKRAATTGAAAAALVGGSQFINTPTTPPAEQPAITQPAQPEQPDAQPAVINPIQDANFIAYIKNAENAALEGRQPNGMWRDHPSGEGGAPTFGYGHKIKKGEDFSQPKFTDAQVEALLMKDLKDADNIVKKKLGIDAYNKLLKEYPAGVQMFIDLAFNIGPAFAVKNHPDYLNYPKFTQGVLTMDMNLMRAEYHRYYTPKGSNQKVPLERRNRLFYDYFLK